MEEETVSAGSDECGSRIEDRRREGERTLGTDNGVQISGGARLSGLDLVRVRDVRAQVSAFEGRCTRLTNIRQDFLSRGFLDEVFAGETEDARQGYEVMAVQVAAVTVTTDFVKSVRMSIVH